MNFVHNDHLGRPEYATNTSQQVVWKAYNYAYGRSVLKDDIGGLNIGFPGQYYDSESGLWYNGFRDYDASAGRYVQSDPIGLAGGWNAYAYAENNPISNMDHFGLESVGSFNNGGHRQRWEGGANIRPVDHIKVQVSLYVFSASRTFSRSGAMFRAGGIARSYPRLSGKLQASVSVGWLNQCDAPTRNKVDDHIGGYGMSGAAGYRGFGGGVNYSPGSGTSTEVGIGIGGGASPGEISERDGSWGSGW